MINIYKDYTTDDVLWDEPYVDSKLTIYPIKVKNYRLIEDKLKYLMLSLKHYERYYDIDTKDKKLFNLMFATNLNMKMDEYKETHKKEKLDYSNEEVATKVTEECFNELIRDLEQLFSVLSREEVYLNQTKWNNEKIILFNNSENTIKIDDSNFSKLRLIVLKQNALSEPVLFQDAVEEKLAKRYMEAKRRKSKGAIEGFGEMANVISCKTGKTYEQLYSQNLLQFYADYYRCINSIKALESIILKTAYQLTTLNSTEEVISDLYKTGYEDMWMDRDKFLGGL